MTKRRATQPHEEVPGGELDWLNKVLQKALCNPNTIKTTYGLARRVIEDRVPGDLVECGVYAGAQAAVMAHVAQSFGDRHRLVHLFDSFQGIPHATEEDTDNIDGTLFDHGRDGAMVTTGIAECSLAQVVANMAEWQVASSQLAYYEGWFKDTIPAARDDLAKAGIAVLRLDGDLYKSTRVCMRELFPLLSPGGYLIVDDWRLAGCQRAVLEFMETYFTDPEWYETDAFVSIPEGGGPVWWQIPVLDDVEEVATPTTNAERRDVSEDVLGSPRSPEYGDVDGRIKWK